MLTSCLQLIQQFFPLLLLSNNGNKLSLATIALCLCITAGP
uniref:Uncharacterized protein n=1 Tax=Arundo donax TaxID=35708 RepID=A0A0A9CD46_ARUDO